MPAPVPEIIWFTSSETQGYTDIVKVLNQANGIQTAFHGRQEEDPNTAVWVNVWDTLEHHDTFVKDTSSAPLFESLKLPDKTSISMTLARLTDPFMEALSAPVTEFATITLKPGHTMAELNPVLADLTSELKPGVAKGSHGSSWGPSGEKPEDVVIGVVGWDNVAAHWEAVRVQGLSDVITRLKNLANVELKHASLKLHAPV